MSYNSDIFITNMEAVGTHARGSKSHVTLLVRFTHPDSDGGETITPAEWALAVEDAEAQAKSATEVLVPLAKRIVLLERVRNNIKHRFELALSLPLEKTVLYSVREHFGLVGQRGRPKTKKEAPSGATNSSGLDRKLGG